MFKLLDASMESIRVYCLKIVGCFIHNCNPRYESIWSIQTIFAASRAYVREMFPPHIATAYLARLSSMCGQLEQGEGK